MRVAIDDRVTRPPSHRTPLVVPLVLASMYTGQCLWFAGTQSLTYDEPTHIIAGLDAWRHVQFTQWNDQPPLARVLLTAPLILSHGSWRLDNLGPSGANFWTISIRPDPVALAWRTRPVNIALGLLLATLLWITARRIFSIGGANLALALFAWSPALIAHFSLATVDGATTLLLFATAISVTRWRLNPSWLATIGVGLVMGGFLVAKFSAPPMVLIALGLMASAGPAGDRAAGLVRTGCAAVLALIVVWAAYGFHVGPVTFRNGALSGPYARSHTVLVPLPRPIDFTVRLPAPEYVSALGGVLQHGVRGQPAFLMGDVRTRGGWRSYFPIVTLLKWPVTVWLLAAASLILLATRRLRASSELGVLMVFPAAFFLLAMMTNLDIGDRYVLPVYPFLLLLSAGVWTAARQRTLTAALVAAVVAIQAADVMRYAPDYLSYFNMFVTPDRSYTLLTDSNLDWGQGLLALRAYERAHPNERISLAYFGGVDPRSYGIRAKLIDEHERVDGTVVVSATHLSGQYLENPAAFHWLLQYPETAILNHTLHVFDVPAGHAR